MSFIGRQQFLAELSKLLTFMYEEDRQRALKMYERMFDIAEDDQGLIQHLISPTRQAVVVARAYDAKERKLSVSTQKKEEGFEESEEIPRFVLAINKVFDDLFPEEDSLTEQENQVSFFDLGVEHAPVDEKRAVVPPAEVLLSDTQNFQVILPPDEAEEAEGESEEKQEEPENVSEELTKPEEPEESEEPEKPEEVSEEPEEPEGEPEESLEVDSILQSVRDMFFEEKAPEKPAREDTAASEQEDTPEPEEKTEEEDEPEEEAKSEMPEEALSSPEEPTAAAAEAESAAANLYDSILPEENETAEEELPETKTEEMPVSGADEPASEEVPVPDEKPERDDLLSSVRDLFPEEDEDARGPIVFSREKPATEKTRGHHSIPEERVTNVPLLVLFLIAAIPITVVLLALTLALTLLSVGVSVALITLGVTLVLAAFSGFAVLADILLLFGAAIVALSLGLVFLWLAFWLIGAVMVGLVRSVRELGMKWCSKEVPTE